MGKRDVEKRRITSLKENFDKKYSNKRFVERRLQSDGTVQIDVVLPEDFNVEAPLAPSAYGLLNSEIYNYIDEQVYFVPSEYDIKVNFTGKQIPTEEQIQISESLHDHYNLQVYDKLDDIRRNRLLGIFLLAFGALALALYFFLRLSNNNLLVLEIISIVGTFSVWESVDCWLINGHERKIELNNALQMALTKVLFNGCEVEMPSAKEIN